MIIKLQFPRLFHSPIAVLVHCGHSGCDSPDESGEDARHAVQIVNAASVVNAELLVHHGLSLRVTPSEFRKFVGEKTIYDLTIT